MGSSCDHSLAGLATWDASSVIRRLCASGCGRITNGGRYCPEHKALEAERRWQRDLRHGTQSSYWRALRAEAKERDGHRCRRCGTSLDLTVHLDPRLKGNHMRARLSDVTTLCRRCHGSIDAARASSSRK
jgi:5-methylcytosine-specific restriction endonuclease McrA